MMEREPNDDDVAYKILAEHLVITKSLHPDAVPSIADALRAAFEEWHEDNAEEYQNQGGA